MNIYDPERYKLQIFSRTLHNNKAANKILTAVSFS